MSDPLSRLPRWQADRLAILIDALGDPPMSYPERASLAWIAGQEDITVHNLAEVIRRAQHRTIPRNPQETDTADYTETIATLPLAQLGEVNRDPGEQPIHWWLCLLCHDHRHADTSADADHYLRVHLRDEHQATGEAIP